MIAFATLFLGLVLGLQDVELTVGDEVATVEVLLNGRVVGTLTGEPWALRCDFGDELAPQELVAVARDAAGREIGRTRQWINLPQPPAHVTVALDGGGGGEGRVARLAWESRVGGRPQSVAVSFDGVPLVVDDPRRIVLPPHDERRLHFLRAELEFSDNVATVAEVAFGGTYTDRVSTELTAVPVLGKKSKVRKPGALDALLLKRGEPLAVVAVDKGTARVVMVPDRASREAHDQLSRFRFEGNLSLAQRAFRLRFYASLMRDQRLRFLWPEVERQQGARQTYDLFPTSPSYDSDAGGVYGLLHHAYRRPAQGEQRLADAVAVAGLHAAEQRQRRGVVLILGGSGGAPDSSQLTPSQARRYLARLRVPLYVWSLAEETEDAGWGEVRDASSLTKLSHAVDELRQNLDRQWLVWLDGIHLPQEVSLAPEAEGIRLVQ